MIEVELSTQPLRPGESRILRAWSDTPSARVEPSESAGQPTREVEAPMSVAIACFVEPPTPAQLRPCPSCGTLPLRNGEDFQIQPDEQLFRETGGGISAWSS